MSLILKPDIVIKKEHSEEDENEHKKMFTFANTHSSHPVETRIRRIVNGINDIRKIKMSCIPDLKKKIYTILKRRDSLINNPTNLIKYRRMSKRVKELQSYISELESGNRYKSFISKMFDLFQQVQTMQNMFKDEFSIDSIVLPEGEDVFEANRSCRNNLKECKSQIVAAAKKLGIFTQELKQLPEINKEYCPKCRVAYFYTCHTSKKVCSRCKDTTTHMELSPLVINNDSNSQYDRVNYEITDVLSIFDEPRKIPHMDELLNVIMSEIHLDRSRCDTRVTITSIKKALETTGNSQYGRDANAIANKINNESPPILTHHQKFLVISVFLEIEEGFNDCINRLSFPNYFRVTKQIFLWLGMPKFAAWCPKLKTPEKEEEQTEDLKLIFANRGMIWIDG